MIFWGVECILAVVGTGGPVKRSGAGADAGGVRPLRHQRGGHHTFGHSGAEASGEPAAAGPPQAAGARATCYDTLRTDGSVMRIYPRFLRPIGPP
eukprot:475956-Prorocentrum_minimum.AAC.1